MLIQLVQIEVRPGMRDAFLEAWRINSDGTRAEPGNIRFDLLADPDDENRFLAYEIFADEAAFAAHRDSAHCRRCVALIEPMMAAPRSKRILAGVMVEGPAARRCD